MSGGRAGRETGKLFAIFDTNLFVLRQQNLSGERGHSPQDIADSETLRTVLQHRAATGTLQVASQHLTAKRQLSSAGLAAFCSPQDAFKLQCCSQPVSRQAVFCNFRSYGTGLERMPHWLLFNRQPASQHRKVSLPWVTSARCLNHLLALLCQRSAHFLSVRDPRRGAELQK